MPKLSVLSMALLAIASSAAASDMLDAGASFPEFSLTAHDGSTISSADLAGAPYLVYYYPKADTPGCTKEACEFRDHWEDVKNAGLKVFGASYDTPEDNSAFAEKYSLQFLLLSDEEKTLAKAIGASSSMRPWPKRISYLVGADGTILKVYPKVSPAEHAGEVLEDLKALTE
ncbi:MAG: peroxiredoxin [bacterium]|nr:peroxiredoxin [bacterium]